ncbi:rhomboid family intramembrane serine protease [Antarctobacter heliothermus]|uniref:Membrane associated serine protease, rhomboid family n=1 Tax=Antarctobacter heliothermus TaxID=74033 RepID=A0A239CZ25_9RHOB|nr:rhomboid family intramembrane serine protease [Antarctobacter heliothermus]SNS24603.1 Membrane associated serine protease, rhomboid family [Antarctobacter heliothermus]
MDLGRFRWLAIFVAVIWGVEAVNLLLGYTLNGWFGLRPRAVGGLDGILFMPILHGSVAHAAANTVPLMLLGGLLAVTARKVALPATVIIVGLGGLGVWLFGQPGNHVGASGLIFGWFAFLVARGLVEKRLVPLIVAAGVVVVYGTMIWGVLPGQPGVSWESHFLGAVAGVAAARVLRSVQG